jgi:hypothetical protein
MDLTGNFRSGLLYLVIFKPFICSMRGSLGEKNETMYFVKNNNREGKYVSRISRQSVMIFYMYLLPS